MCLLYVALRSSAPGSATVRSRQRVKSAGGWPRVVPMPRCQTAGAGDAASRSLVSENFKKIQRPKTVRKLSTIMQFVLSRRFHIRVNVECSSSPGGWIPQVRPYHTSPATAPLVACEATYRV